MSSYEKPDKEVRRSFEHYSDVGSDDLLLEYPLSRVHNSNTIRHIIHWVLHGLSTIIILALSMLVYQSRLATRAKCFDMFNYYSPVNEGVVPFPYVERQFNGSLWHETPWTGPPNDQVVEEWHKIMEFGLIRIEADDIAKVQQPEWSAQFPDELGGGYIAATIGSHQIHCLYYMWQDHYMSYFPEVQSKKHRVPEMYERHYEHCTDYIRQTLMCQFDTGVMPYAWVLDHQKPTPNGNTWHKCVDWDRVQEHLASKAVEKPDDWKWYQPEGVHAMSWNP